MGMIDAHPALKASSPQAPPQDQFFGRRRGKNLVEENLQVRIRHHFEPQRRFAHFADAFAQSGDVLGAEVRVQAETHFQLVNRLGGDARGEDLVQPFEGIVVALEAAHTFFNGQAGVHRLGHEAKSGELRQVSVGGGAFHGSKAVTTEYHLPNRVRQVFLRS